MNENSANALKILGLCKKAGKLVCGTPLVCAALSKKTPPSLCVVSVGASDNTKKRLYDKCRYYGVELCELSVSTDELSAALGGHAQTASAAICDEGLAQLFLAKAENEIKRNEE